MNSTYMTHDEDASREPDIIHTSYQYHLNETNMCNVVCNIINVWFMHFTENHFKYRLFKCI